MDETQPATLGIKSEDLGGLGAAAVRDMGGICLDNGDTSPHSCQVLPQETAGERALGGTGPGQKQDLTDALKVASLSELGSEEDGRGSRGSNGMGLEASPERQGWDMGSQNGDRPEEDQLEKGTNRYSTPGLDSPAPSSSYTGPVLPTSMQMPSPGEMPCGVRLPLPPGRS